MVAIGFLARPLGGMVFGNIGDKLGRRTALISSVVSMAVPGNILAPAWYLVIVSVIASWMTLIMKGQQEELR
jgi:MFS family permease